MSQLERQVEQLIARVRDLEAELARLRESDQGRRCFAEVILAAPEGSDTLPSALTDVTSGAQSVSGSQASVLELIDTGGGTLTLKPIQNSSGGNKLKVNYWNATRTAPQLWPDSDEPMLLVRMRDGRFVRVPSGSGGGADTIDVVTDFSVSGNFLQYRKKRIKATLVSDLGLQNLIELVCS